MQFFKNIFFKRVPKVLRKPKPIPNFKIAKHDDQKENILLKGVQKDQYNEEQIKNLGKIAHYNKQQRPADIDAKDNQKEKVLKPQDNEQQRSTDIDAKEEDDLKRVPKVSPLRKKVLKYRKPQYKKRQRSADIDAEEDVETIRIPNTIKITFTGHPTITDEEVLQKFKNPDGSLRRPTLQEEVSYYYGTVLPQLMTTLLKSKSPNIKFIEELSVWMGFDMDRHQDERDGIFLYSYLWKVKGILTGYKLNGYDIKDGVIDDITNVLSYLDKGFEKKTKINMDEIQSNLLSISEKLNQIKNDVKEIPLFPILGLKAHYRISSEDLKTEEGINKILERLRELKHIRDTFGVLQIAEIIIANCTSKEEIKQLYNLAQQVGLENDLSVVPLIEEDIGDKELEAIIDELLERCDKEADNDKELYKKIKIMFAGSDSIAEETWVGATIIKCKIQKYIHKKNKERRAKGKKPVKITFFEGTGSYGNRNGNKILSKGRTIFKYINYARTIQGQQFMAFAQDGKYFERIIDNLVNAERCTYEEGVVGQEILEQIHEGASVFQKKAQTEPSFTQNFDVKKILKVLINNSHHGSRAKTPQESGFCIKKQRAIVQSAINTFMGYHPEMLYWDKLPEKTKNLIKNNINNPIVQDFLNHYTTLHQFCDLKVAKSYIKNDAHFAEFKKGYQSFGKFMNEIKGMNLSDTIKNKLYLQNYHDKRHLFACEDMSPTKFRKLYNQFLDDRRNLSIYGDRIVNGKTRQTVSQSLYKKKIFKRIGFGFGTSNKPKLSINGPLLSDVLSGCQDFSTSDSKKYSKKSPYSFDDKISSMIPEIPSEWEDYSKELPDSLGTPKSMFDMIPTMVSVPSKSEDCSTSDSKELPDSLGIPKRMLNMIPEIEKERMSLNALNTLPSNFSINSDKVKDGSYTDKVKDRLRECIKI